MCDITKGGIILTLFIDDERTDPSKLGQKQAYLYMILLCLSNSTPVTGVKEKIT
jgi:hypothetical protein